LFDENISPALREYRQKRVGATDPRQIFNCNILFDRGRKGQKRDCICRKDGEFH